MLESIFSINKNSTASSTRRLLVGLLLIVVLLVGLLVLVASNLYLKNEPWKTTANVVGGFMAISVIASYLYSVTIKPLDNSARISELKELIDEKITLLIRERFQYGISEFIPKMDYSKLFDDLCDGDELWWLDTYAPGHKLWMQHFRDAVARGVNIKMLVLSPGCQNADHRANEIGGLFSPQKFNSDLRDFIDSLYLEIKGFSGRKGAVEIREYSDLPGMPIYIVSRDGEPFYGYTSFFLSQPSGVDFPHLKWIPAKEGVLNHFFVYIKNKWERNQKNT